MILPNGTPFSQQATYESLPCFCKRCHVIGHSANAWNKGPKKWPHTASAGLDFGSPFEETVAMEKQQPYSATPLVDPICIRS